MFKKKFEEHAALLPPVKPEEVDRYDALFALLREWNEKINLVSRASIDTSFEYHFADSLHIAQTAHDYLYGRQLRDLGTGAGFPGVVFAIRYPEIPVTLYEKMEKRRLYLTDIIEKLELKNVTLQGALPEVKYRDLFTARAVFKVSELFPFMKRHLVNGGRLVVNTGGASEPFEVPTSYRVLHRNSYDLPGEAGTRKISVYEYVPRETK
jgi:16S rRNA (guanine527-N7)-methyltransferase